MSSAGEEENSGAPKTADGGSSSGLGRLERQAERERARAEAQRVMDMCASRSAMQIFEAVGGDVEGSGSVASSRNMSSRNNSEVNTDNDTIEGSLSASTGTSPAASSAMARDTFARSFLWRDHDDGDEVVHSMSSGEHGQHPSSSGVFGRGLFGTSHRRGAAGGSPSKRTSNTNFDLSAIRMSGGGGGGSEADRRRSSLFSVDLRSSILGGGSRFRASFFGGDGRKKKNEDAEFHRNIAPRRHSHTALDFDPSVFEGIEEEEGACSTLRGTVMSKCRQHKKMLLVLAAAAAVVTIGVVGLTVGGSHGAISFLGIRLPQKDRSEAMKTILVKSGVSKTSSFDDRNSLQSRALQWIASDDPSSISVKDPYMPQRYALACLWFASLSDASNQNDEDSVGRRRLHEHDDSGEHADDERPKWVKDDNWLSVTGLCAWEGITCHHNPNGALSETHYDANNGITAIALPSNGLRGALPREIFTALPDLISLDLKDNEIIALPDEIGSATKLEFLRLENCAVQNLPSSIGNMKGLRLVNLYHNAINGTIPATIAELPDLRELYLDSNFLTGTIEGIFDDMPNLVDLRLRRNLLSGSVPSFSGLDNLAILYLDANRLTGTLSDSFGEGMPKLKELTLYKNLLTGELPSSMSQMSRLQHLYIDHNGFEGSFPQSWGNLKALKHLFTYKNALSGTLDVVTEMVSMEKLRLEENQFSGTISSAFGALKNLEVLVLSDNDKISGELPPELGQLSKLSRLMAPNTNIDGIVPEEVCSLTRDYVLAEFVMTCRGRGMEGGVLCSCCTECKSDLEI